MWRTSAASRSSTFAAGLVCAALTAATPAHAAAESTARSTGSPARIQALVDVACSAHTKRYALKSRALISEWYPKINAILYGDDRPLPFKSVMILFEPALGAPAITSGNIIHADCSYIDVMTDDYRALIVHELTHVVQHYPRLHSDAVWISESIADYVRHKYFEKDIRERLSLLQNGVPSGYTNKQPYLQSLEHDGISLDRRGYLKSYTVGATFLFWLERQRRPGIVQELNLALSQGRYTPDLFEEWCGVALDELWAQFLIQSKSKRS